jgi:hypothetical protein
MILVLSYTVSPCRVDCPSELHATDTSSNTVPTGVKQSRSLHQMAINDHLRITIFKQDLRDFDSLKSHVTHHSIAPVSRMPLILLPNAELIHVTQSPCIRPVAMSGYLRRLCSI